MNPPFSDLFLPNSKSASDKTAVKKCLLIYQITRLEIETGFVDRLVYDLRPTDDNPMVHAGPGRCFFTVTGYDDDSRELFEIPEFVAFVRKANEFSPCWLYFSHPGYRKIPASRWLNLISFCSINNAAVVRQKGNDKFNFACAEDEIMEFVAGQMDDFNAMCSTAKVHKKAIKESLSKIHQCLGIN